MTSLHGKASPEIEAFAAQRLAEDEQRITGQRAGRTPRRTSVTLGTAWRSFLHAPSPWMIGGFLTAAVVGRVLVGGGSWWELVIPAALLAAFPLVEWVVHVCILHWRPRPLGPVTVDSLLARKHRAHHADPRDIPLVFIPWPVLVWLLPAYVALGWLVMPTTASALTLLVSVYGIMFGYEWIHYLVHSDYRPRSRWYRHVWRNHRLHQYNNEHYWFGVATAGTADRLLGTYPDSGDVDTSPTVKTLHATDAGGGHSDA